jgi:hypothetical protein
MTLKSFQKFQIYNIDYKDWRYGALTIRTPKNIRTSSTAARDDSFGNGSLITFNWWS